MFIEADVELVLANPQRIKAIPGRKTDKQDAKWIAELGRYGFIEGSHLPCEESLQLRNFTRRYRSYKQKFTQCKNEIHNILQRANIKLTSYLSDIFGKTGCSLLQLFINGEKVAIETVVRCMHGKVKATPEQLVEAMEGKLSSEDRYLLEQSLEELQFYEKKINELDQLINQYVKKHFPVELELLLTLPGISNIAAAVILAEIGPSIEPFETPKHLASWAGVCPGSYESAGKRKASHITQGNKYLKHVLVMAGGRAGRSKDIAFSAHYHRVAQHSGKMKAQVACGHKLLRIIYVMLEKKQSYSIEKALGQRQLTKST